MKKNAMRHILVISFLLVSYVLLTLLVCWILELYSLSGRAVVFVTIGSLLLLLLIYKIYYDLRSAKIVNRQLRQANLELTSLKDISELLNSPFELSTILVRSVKIITEMLPFESCSIWTFNAKKYSLSLAAAQLPEELILPQEVSGGIGLARSAFRQGETVFIGAPEDELTGEELQFCRQAGIRSLMVHPIFHGSVPLGLIVMMSRQSNQFDPQMRNLFTTYVNAIALAIRNAQLYEKVHEQAIKDELTGLYNHRYLMERLKEESQRALRLKHPLSLLMFDLDNFKQFNDNYGHMAGNEVLAQMGSLFKEEIRGMDIPVRFGGEEFVIVLPETDITIAVQVAERLQQAIRKHPYITSDGKEVQVTFSVGAATMPHHAKTPTELLRQADAMLYKAKEKKDSIAACGLRESKEAFH